MKNKITVCLGVAGLLALVAGCGKTENVVPPTSETEKTASAIEAEPSRATEALVAKTTNTGQRALETAVSPVTEAAPKLMEATNLPPNESQEVGTPAPTTLAALSQDQMVQGLKDALAKGLQQAIADLGHEGGFLTNLNVRIPMPEKMQKVETALRAMKQEKLADDFVTTMNRAAEQAVPAAGSVFADALKQMNIEDARSILSGPNNAATQYFQKTTQTNLYARFYPIVQKATAQTGVTAAYKNLMEKANVGQGFGSALGSTVLGKDSMDIDAYVTNKAMDGLFKMVAEQEQQIRQNPVARTTDLLQKVFGAIKQ